MDSPLLTKMSYLEFGWVILQLLSKTAPAEEFATFFSLKFLLHYLFSFLFMIRSCWMCDRFRIVAAVRPLQHFMIVRTVRRITTPISFAFIRYPLEIFRSRSSHSLVGSTWGLLLTFEIVRHRRELKPNMIVISFFSGLLMSWTEKERTRRKFSNDHVSWWQ